MKEKRFEATLIWREVNGRERGSINRRIIDAGQLAAAQENLRHKTEPKQEQNRVERP